MAVTNVSGKQAQADMAVRQTQRNQNKAVGENKRVQGNKAAEEDVRVTLNSGNRKTGAKKTGTTENARMEAQQRPQENRNVETRRAVQAYENANRVAEGNNARPESAARKGINRIAGV